LAQISRAPGTVSRGRHDPPPSLETYVPWSVEIAHRSASAGLMTTSIGGAGGVRVSHERPPSRLTEMSGDSTSTATISLPATSISW